MTKLPHLASKAAVGIAATVSSRDRPCFLSAATLSRIEIAATKVYTIGRRGAYKDYIDLYFILSDQHVTFTDIIDVAEKKFGFEFNSRLFLE